MERDEIKSWTKKGYDQVCSLFKFRDDWWPNGMGDQKDSTLWAMAIMLEAARTRCVGDTLVASYSGGRDGDRKRQLLDHMWAKTSTTSKRRVEESEVLVDFSVHHWDSAAPVQFTGESEMHQAHGVGDSMTTTDDYSWDFFKLLVVPSPTRVFVARVGGADGIDSGHRCLELATTLRRLIDRYGLAYLKSTDELGGVIIPSSVRQWEKTIFIWTERGRLRLSRSSPWP